MRRKLRSTSCCQCHSMRVLGLLISLLLPAILLEVALLATVVAGLLLVVTLLVAATAATPFSRWSLVWLLVVEHLAHQSCSLLCLHNTATSFAFNQQCLGKHLIQTWSSISILKHSHQHVIFRWQTSQHSQHHIFSTHSMPSSLQLVTNTACTCNILGDALARSFAELTELAFQLEHKHHAPCPVNALQRLPCLPRSLTILNGRQVVVFNTQANQCQGFCIISSINNAFSVTPCSDSVPKPSGNKQEAHLHCPGRIVVNI